MFIWDFFNEFVQEYTPHSRHSLECGMLNVNVDRLQTFGRWDESGGSQREPQEGSSAVRIANGNSLEKFTNVYLQIKLTEGQFISKLNWNSEL